MQIEYNILWIDDEMEDFKSVGDIDRIESFLTEHGFIHSITLLTSGAELEQVLASKKFDLILSDFNIDEEGQHGDDIIKQIRKSEIFTEILFYSSQSNLQAIAEKLLAVDRISFHSQRRGLIEKIEQLITLTTAKLLELNPTRGLITSETSELDHLMELIAHKVLDDMQADEKFSGSLEKIYKCDYKEIKKNLIKKCLSQRETHLTNYKQYFVYSESFRRWDILRELIKLNPPKDFDLELFKRYGAEVIGIRNKMAHAKVESIEGKLFLKGQYGAEDFNFDKTGCINIRKNLINHRRNFNILLSQYGLT